MHLKLLYNPAAGRGRAKRHVAEAVACLRGGGARVDLSESDSPANLTELAAAASRGSFDRVVICGGDGSLSLAIRRYDLGGVPMAILPFGSGDDFAQTLGISREVRSACSTVVNGRVREVDVALVNGTRYLGVAGLGFDSEVAERANLVKWLRGSLVYLYSIVRVLPRFRPCRVKLRVDGVTTEVELMFAAVGNTHRYGAGIQIVPPARPDDGELDVCIVKRCSRLELLKTLPKAYSGKHITSPFVVLKRGREMHFEAERVLPVYADGERIGVTPATMTLEAQRLRVVAP